MFPARGFIAPCSMRAPSRWVVSIVSVIIQESDQPHARYQQRRHHSILDSVATTPAAGMRSVSAGRTRRSQLNEVSSFVRHVSLHTKTPVICPINIVRSRLTSEARYEKNFCADTDGRMYWKRAQWLHRCARRRLPYHDHDRYHDRY
jgi:hypothetical protein